MGKNPWKNYLKMLPDSSNAASCSLSKRAGSYVRSNTIVNSGCGYHGCHYSNTTHSHQCTAKQVRCQLQSANTSRQSVCNKRKGMRHNIGINTFHVPMRHRPTQEVKRRVRNKQGSLGPMQDQHPMLHGSQSPLFEALVVRGSRVSSPRDAHLSLRRRWGGGGGAET